MPSSQRQTVAQGPQVGDWSSLKAVLLKLHYFCPRLQKGRRPEGSLSVKTTPGTRHLLGRHCQAGPDSTETSSGNKPLQESESSLSARTRVCQAGPGCTRLRVGAVVSAAACVSGSAAEPPWLSPPALSCCQLLESLPSPVSWVGGSCSAFPSASPLLRCRALCARVAAFPPRGFTAAFSLSAIWHCLRIAASATP